VLLKEVYHRVKNNLQVVSSLLDLQSRHLGGKSSKAVLQDCANRVKSMALVTRSSISRVISRDSIRRLRAATGRRDFPFLRRDGRPALRRPGS
jgi:two-component sensor histidine kinase